jgi:hypothetical protein
MDMDYSAVPDGNNTTQKQVVVFETEHHYIDGKDIERKIEMHWANEIEIEFDPMCATELGTDYLQIFDRSEGGSLVGKNLSGPAGSANWPSKIVIQLDLCRLLFHVDESQNDWGILCTISAYVPVVTRQFKPDICITMTNLVSYAISRLLQQALISLPISEQEKDFSSILGSEIMNAAQSVFCDPALIELLVQIPEMVAKIARRSG